jgi:hypothetical protein
LKPLHKSADEAHFADDEAPFVCARQNQALSALDGCDHFCTNPFRLNITTATPNKTVPITSRAVMGTVRFFKVPPRANVVKPSQPQALGVILLMV